MRIHVSIAGSRQAERKEALFQFTAGTKKLSYWKKKCRRFFFSFICQTTSFSSAVSKSVPVSFVDSESLFTAFSIRRISINVVDVTKHAHAWEKTKHCSCQRLSPFVFFFHYPEKQETISTERRKPPIEMWIDSIEKYSITIE